MYAKHWDINAYHTHFADLCQFAAIQDKVRQAVSSLRQVCTMRRHSKHLFRRLLWLILTTKASEPVYGAAPEGSEIPCHYVLKFVLPAFSTVHNLMALWPSAVWLRQPRRQAASNAEPALADGF